MKLAMSILVRDEADIIEDNIRYHAKQGISQFVVTDNGSSDGTREILDKLSEKFPITILDELSHTIDSDIWVTRMAHWLTDNSDAEWVINNDADEFWVSESGSLVDDLDSVLSGTEGKIGVVHCTRFNLLPDRQAINNDQYRFFHNTYKVNKDLEADFFTDNLNVLLTRQGTKVICRLQGLDSINVGNHDAIHNLDSTTSQNITIAHYPLRSYDQFVKKVTNHGSSILQNDRFGEGINWHLRRWYEQLQAGHLYDEYLKYVVSDETRDQLIDREVISVERSMEKYFT